MVQLYCMNAERFKRGEKLQNRALRITRHEGWGKCPQEMRNGLKLHDNA